MVRSWPTGYYTYVFFIEGIPYYVGAGKGSRADSRKHPKVRGIDRLILCIIYEQANKEAASALEIQLIQEYGRRCEGSGPLINKYSGGQGVGKQHSIETRKKLAASKTGGGNAMFGKKHSAASRQSISESLTGNQHLRGKKYTKEQRLQMSESRRGRKMSDSTKASISKSMKGNQSFLGKKHSPETKARMAEARRNYWANKEK